MADVTFLGIGNLGQAMARCAMRGGHETVVWNGTAARAEGLTSEGAHYIPEVSAAINESPLVIVCVDDYKATDSFLKTSEVEASLKGRILIQLSTGTPNDARTMCEWANSVDAKYLDGAIVAIPNQIGKDEASIYVGGDRKIYEQAESILKLLAPDTKYVGEDPGYAAILDNASQSVLYAAFVGVIHGTAMCEAGGASLRDYSELLRSRAFTEIMSGVLRYVVHKVSTDDLQTKSGAKGLRGMTALLDHIVKSSNETGISSEVPAFFKSLYERAEDRGLAEYSLVAMIEVLRKV